MVTTLFRLVLHRSGKSWHLRSQWWKNMASH